VLCRASTLLESIIKTNPQKIFHQRPDQAPDLFLTRIRYTISLNKLAIIVDQVNRSLNGCYFQVTSGFLLPGRNHQTSKPRRYSVRLGRNLARVEKFIPPFVKIYFGPESHRQN
jgi:hypothetical protein